MSPAARNAERRRDINHLTKGDAMENEDPTMDEQTLQDNLMSVLDELPEGTLQDQDGNEFNVHRTTSFQADGVLTSNRGFTLRMMDGSEFQISIVRSK